MNFDPEKFGQRMSAIVRETVAREVTPLRDEIATLQKRLEIAEARDPDPEMIRSIVAEAVSAIPLPENGRDGIDGRSVDPEEVRAIVDAAVSAIPPAEPGRDGTSVTPEDVAPMIAQEVEKAVSAIPHPRDGIDGKDGASVTVEEIAPLVSDAVERAVASIPVPKDGKDGRDGADARGIADLLIDREGDLVATFTDGVTKRLGRIVGTDGRDGRDGIDGKSFTGGEIDADGHLHLTRDDGSKIDLGMVKGSDGTDGRDGIDGKDGLTFTLDDFDLKQTDERTLEFSFVKGDTAHTFEIAFPVVLDRGAWTEREFKKGDSVSWGGSTWIAQRDTTPEEKPGSSDAWRLSVKRGRDGKPGKDAQ